VAQRRPDLPPQQRDQTRVDNQETERELTALRRSTTKARRSATITGKPKPPSASASPPPSAPAEGQRRKYENGPDPLIFQKDYFDQFSKELIKCDLDDFDSNTVFIREAISGGGGDDIPF
jgi:hypothetical protein